MQHVNHCYRRDGPEADHEDRGCSTHYCREPEHPQRRRNPLRRRQPTADRLYFCCRKFTHYTNSVTEMYWFDPEAGPFANLSA